jgi:hypothetical protein
VTDEEKIRTLEDALTKPEGKYSHAQIRQKIDSLKVKPAAPPEIEARRRGMTHQPGEGARQYDPKSDPRGPEESQAAAGFGERVKAFGRGVKAIGSSIRHPIDTARSPEKVRQLFRGIDDVGTLGYGREIADSIHERQGHGRPLRDIQAHDEEVAPDYRTAGGIAGMFNPLGVTGMAAKAGSGVLRLPAAGVASGAGSGMIRGLVGYEASAPALAAAHAESAGNRAGAAKEAATDPLGLILSGVAGGFGGSARGNAAKIRDPRNRSGQVIRTIEETGGPNARIRMFGEPAEGGIFETPEMKTSAVGREGREQLANQSVTRINEANNARLRDARAQFQDAKDGVIMEHADKPFPTTRSHAMLDVMEAENTVNGQVGDPGVASALNKVRSFLTQQGGQTDEQATIANMMRKMGMRPDTRLTPQARQAMLKQAAPEDMVMRPARQVTAEDMVKSRKIVRSLANDAQTASEKRTYEMVLRAMDDDAAAIDPRIAEMNANYHKALTPIDRSDEILFNKSDRKTDGNLSEAQRRTGEANLMRMGEDTQAAVVRNPATEELRQLGPEYAAEVRRMRAKNALEMLRRGEPGTSSAIEKTLNRLRPSYGTFSGASIGAASGNPIAAALLTAGGFALDKYRENRLPNQVRLGLPASKALGRITGRSAVGADEVSRLAVKRGKKKRKEQEASP